MIIAPPQTSADWAQVFTALAAIVALFYTAFQIRRNTQISRGHFWLELERMFSNHDEAHLKLRPGGDWRGDNKGPSTSQDWIQVEDYMGLLEHCEIMLEKKLLDFDTFESIFGYRVGNILCNNTIVEQKLIQRGKWWKKFINLMVRLKPGFSDELQRVVNRVLESQTWRKS